MRLKAVRGSLLLALPFQVGSIVLAVVLAAAGLQVEVLLTVLLALSMWAPAAAELLFRTTLPRALQLHYLIFLVAGPFLGSALHVYWVIADWDTLIHFDSGVLLAWLGMLWLRRVEEQLEVALPTWFGLLVIQLTPMAFAAAWEICEFASDHILGTKAQLDSLVDTMGDIMAGSLGGLFAIALLLVLRRPRTVAPASLLRATRRTAEADEAPTAR
ncbi:hypothetical protein [Microbacterium kyungheense]|uniref:DUF2238 domain-containing protein n=1 Tax=Microbacterium kyungheense TaxID=1263636 RepID=A0A543EFD9_9MICO|nr:hypothetical protein [Microbacterium kyungheense]TQM20219.1 hypothetical protein FB391_3355 [Microbacterium kyungheense]